MTLSRWLDKHPHLVTFLALVGMVAMCVTLALFLSWGW